MAATRNNLERIVPSGQAVMTIDYGERVTGWSKEAERLLGIPARHALGRPCYEVLGGRDIFGNRYCHRACPIAHQARHSPEEPVRSFPLDVKTASGKTRRVVLSTFAVPTSRRSLATVAHVIAEPGRGKVRPPAVADAPVALTAAVAVSPRAEPRGLTKLSSREREVLRCITEGLQTSAIARRLGIKPVTVRNHAQAILKRLGVHSRLAAVRVAADRKLL